MTDRPVIMSAASVRAIVAGTKTETRRVIRPQPDPSPGTLTGPHQDCDSGLWGMVQTTWRFSDRLGNYEPEEEIFRPFRIPEAGDRLWVREAWAPISPDEHERPIRECRIEYRADTTAEAPGHWDEVERGERPRYARWRPSIHMPRWASRITLAVTEVRVERLQEISRESAIAEGLALASSHIEQFWRWPPPYDEGLWLSPVAAYRFLWDSLHGEGAWNANPWVAVIRFVPTLANIDSGGA